MDTGTAPANGYVAIYAIYNPTTGASALLATNATSTKAPEVYSGANMPAGMKASALVSVWPTNSSGQFINARQADRHIDIAGATALSASSNQPTVTALSISSIVPPNAKFISGTGSSGSSATSNSQMTISSTATTGARQFFSNLPGPGAIASSFAALPLAVPQTIYYNSVSTSGTPSFSIFINGYDI